MYRRILVPLDGSPLAEEALPIAGRLARASGGTVMLLRVVPAEEVATLAEGQASQPTSSSAEIEEQASLYLAQTARSDYLMGINVETDVVRSQAGQAISAILEMVPARLVDLIVMCSHRYSGMKRWTLGSIAEQVAHLAPVPTLLLREGGALTTSARPQSEGPTRILVSLDGTTHAETALLPAVQLITALAAPATGALHLVRVVVLPDEAHISQGERETILWEAGHYLESTVERLREGLLARSEAGPSPAITWSVTIDDDIAAGIIRLAEEGKETGEAGEVGRCDVIAMTTRGQARTQQGILGSMTERVLDATRLPLLVMKGGL